MTLGINDSQTLFRELFRSRTLYNVVLLTGLCGYTIVAGLTSLVDLANMPVSAALRTITAGAALLIILKNMFEKRSKSTNYFLVAIAFFWCLYILRLFEATAMSDVPMWHGPYYYWMWAMLGCAIPMFGLAIYPTYNEDLDSIFLWIYLLFLIAGVLAVIGASNYAGRLHLESLDPISLGHLGATICILPIWALIYRGGGTPLYRFGMALGVILGFYLLVSANSRGPLVAFGMLLAFLILVSRGRYALLLIAISAGVVILFVPLSLLLEYEFGIQTFSRLFGQSFFEEINVSIRLEMYREAIEGVIAHPLTGLALELPDRKSYPHNIILEAFMAVGILGGGAFLVVVVGLVVKGIVLSRHHPEQGWIVLIFIQNLIGAQFTGALYSTTSFWISVGAMISLTCTSRYHPSE